MRATQHHIMAVRATLARRAPLTPSTARQLSDGTWMPYLSYGNGSEDADIPFLEVGEMVIQAGFRGLDTASGYASHQREKQTGTLFKKLGLGRDEIYLTTKLSPRNNYTEAIPVNEIRSHVLQSLEYLQRKPHLYLVHMPHALPKGQIAAGWKVLENLKDEGILDSIGVSNFTQQELQEVLKDCRHKPVVNQIEFHPYVLSHVKGLLDFHAKHNIQTSSIGIMTPILSGRGGRLDPVLSRIAQSMATELNRKVDPGAILALWQRSQGCVAVTSSGNKDRIFSQAGICELPDLSPEHVQEITEIGSEVYFRRYKQYIEDQIPPPSLPCR